MDRLIALKRGQLSKPLGGIKDMRKNPNEGVSPGDWRYVPQYSPEYCESCDYDINTGTWEYAPGCRFCDGRRLHREAISEIDQQDNSF